MKKRSVAVLVAVLIVLLPVIYWRLGGFNPIRLFISDRADVKLLGLTYRGTPQDPGMLDTFQQIENIIHKYPHSHLHTLYYIEPAGKLDTLEVFVGLEFQEQLVGQNNLEPKTISCSQVIIAEIKAHKFVMPSPEKVKHQIEAFAEASGIPVQGIYIDKIIDNNQVQVIAPVDGARQ